MELNTLSPLSLGIEALSSESGFRKSARPGTFFQNRTSLRLDVNYVVRPGTGSRSSLANAQWSFDALLRFGFWPTFLSFPLFTFELSDQLKIEFSLWFSWVIWIIKCFAIPLNFIDGIIITSWVVVFHLVAAQGWVNIGLLFKFLSDTLVSALEMLRGWNLYPVGVRLSWFHLVVFALVYGVNFSVVKSPRERRITFRFLVFQIFLSWRFLNLWMFLQISFIFLGRFASEFRIGFPLLCPTKGNRTPRSIASVYTLFGYVSG